MTILTWISRLYKEGELLDLRFQYIFYVASLLSGPAHGLKLWCGGSKEKVKILVWQLWQQQRKSKNIGMAAATPAIPVPPALHNIICDEKSAT